MSTWPVGRIGERDVTRIRVLFCIPNLTGGGAEKVASQIAAGLDRERFDVTLFVHEKLGRFVGVFDDRVRVVYGGDQPYSRAHLPRLFCQTYALVRLADIVVGANEGRATGLALLCAKLQGKPCISWIHVDWSQFAKYTSWRARFGLRFSTSACEIVTCSQGAREALQRLLPETTGKCTDITNGIDINGIRASAQAAVPFPAGPSIVTVGRLQSQKNQQMLIRAHAHLRPVLEHSLVIVGEGPLLDELKALVAELNVTDSVHFLGFQLNPYPYMRQGTVFALTSAFEGLAIVLIEAMALGTPVVSIDCPSGPAEVLDGGRYGILAEDFEALCRGLRSVLTAREEERNEMRVRSFAGASRYDLRQALQTWEALLFKHTVNSQRDDRPRWAFGATRASRRRT